MAGSRGRSNVRAARTWDGAEVAAGQLGGMCLHTILIDPSDPAADVHRHLGCQGISDR